MALNKRQRRLKTRKEKEAMAFCMLCGWDWSFQPYVFIRQDGKLKAFTGNKYPWSALKQFIQSGDDAKFRTIISER